jgi:hypothetical protein
MVRSGSSKEIANASGMSIVPFVSRHLVYFGNVPGAAIRNHPDLRHTVSERHCRNEKAQAPGRTDRIPSHLCLAHYRPGLIGYQTGARIVRQAQEQTEPEYIRPCTVSSKLAVTPVASKSTYDVRWGKPDMGIEIQFARVTEAGQPE